MVTVSYPLESPTLPIDDVGNLGWCNLNLRCLEQIRCTSFHPSMKLRKESLEQETLLVVKLLILYKEI